MADLIKETTNIALNQPDVGHTAWEEVLHRNNILTDLLLNQVDRGNYVISGGNLIIASGNDLDVDATEVYFAGDVDSFSIIAQTLGVLVTGNNYIAYIDNAGAAHFDSVADAGLWAYSLPTDYVLLGVIFELDRTVPATPEWVVLNSPLVSLKTIVHNSASAAFKVRNKGAGNALEILKASDGSVVFSVDNVGNVTLPTLNATEINVEKINFESTKNLLINGNLDVWQRDTNFTSGGLFNNNDGDPLADKWFLLSDGDNQVEVLEEINLIPPGSLSSMKFIIPALSGTANKFGIIQFIEASIAQKLLAGTASLSFQARTTSGQVKNLRAALLSWDGAVDSFTLDVVSVWGVEGVNPTFVANWLAENTSVNLALSDVYQTFAIDNIPIITSGMINLAVFVWVDDLDLIENDVFYITQIKLEEGDSSTVYEREDPMEILEECERFFQKSYDEDVLPGSITRLGAEEFNPSVFDEVKTIKFIKTMKEIPSIVFLSEASADTAGVWSDIDGVSDLAMIAENISTKKFHVFCSASGGYTPGNRMSGHWYADVGW